MHSSDRVQRGFSLIETIVATGLLVAALVTLAQFVGMGVQSGACGEDAHDDDVDGGAEDGSS